MDSTLSLAPLGQHPFYDGLPSEVVAVLDQCAWPLTLAAGDRLFREGGTADAFYLIVHGAVAIEVTMPGQKTVVLQTLHEGNSLGWSWLLPPYRWTFGARACSPCRLYALDADKLRATVASNHEMGFHILSRCIASMGDRLHAARMQMLGS